LKKISVSPYQGPAGGWGSARSLGEILVRERVPDIGATTLLKQNQQDGFACVSCAWPKPADHHVLEYCENGAKATAWEITRLRTTPEFFAAHTCAELRGWADYDLEQQGRLTHPMRWDGATDKYLPVSWDSAFAEIGRELKTMQPDNTIWYASGRAALETSFMWALAARLCGTNNLPDSSNMCHESTSVGLMESIGQSVGTTVFEDLEKTDCIFFFGQNPGTNSPRALHPLAAAHKRGVPIITFNPVRERGLERFTNPQSPIEMLTGQSTPISSQYHQLHLGGDIAVILGMCKYLIALDDAGAKVLDHEFIAEHTDGFAAFAEVARAAEWPALEARSGLTRAAIESAASVYARSNRVIAIYGMGLTQHVQGVDNVQMLVNFMLLRGNIGKAGAGMCPVRGHSNVQGQRTVGISEKPELVPLDKFEARYGFSAPRHLGQNTVDACEAILAGKTTAFLGLGGNFIRAIPEREMMEAAWSKLRLTVQISTKLNRVHLVHGEISYILPCLGRIERDVQASGEQSVSMEDSTACIHGSKGNRPPASKFLLSEPKIVAEIAKSFLPPNPNIPWDEWVGDYAKIRHEIGEIYPDFANMEARMWAPGGFHRDLAANQRIWKTATGKARITIPRSLQECIKIAEPDGVLRMMTMRSNDQFNTTIYGYSDRFRGIEGTRMVVLMNPADIAKFNLSEGEISGIRTVSEDGVTREMTGFRVTAYNIPAGNIGTYYPEANALIPLAHHAERSKVPAAKSVPVRLFKP
jgi:molybdopterin-dependent oxidoreductase alpha subunit